MAITICTTVSKKIPDPNTQYANNQASLSVSAEVTDFNQIHVEAARLFAEAEAAVDKQLKISTPAPVPTATTSSTAAAPTLTFENGNPPRQSPAAGQPRSYPRTGARRAPAPATDSQLRFLDRLITQTGTSVDAICSAHRVGSLPDLSCKEAAGVIDDLKSRSVAA